MFRPPMSLAERLSPENLDLWRRKYRAAQSAFVIGDISHVDAGFALRALGYRDQALKTELLIWTAKREEHRRQARNA